MPGFDDLPNAKPVVTGSPAFAGDDNDDYQGYRVALFSSASESDGLNSEPINLPSDRLRSVSISTLTLMPDRRSLVSWSGSNAIRTGTRCTTFTQFPLAFCGGRMANWAPVPGLTVPTVPWKVWPGKESTSIATFWPMCR